MELTASVQSMSIPRPATQICPECRGKGFTIIEVHELATVWAPEYPVTIPVTAYKSHTCWRCHGRGLIREEG